MKKDSKDSRVPVRLVYTPDISDIAAGLAEGLKSDGREIEGRIFYKRDYTFSPEDAAMFRKRFDQALKKLEGPEPMTMQPRLFVSYAREDYEFIKPFVKSFNKLAPLGVKTWIDVDDVSNKENWIDEIVNALSSCWGVMFFRSNYANESDVVAAELGFTIERMTRRSGVFNCFAMLDHDAGDYDFLRELNIPVIDLYKMTSEEAAKRVSKEMLKFFWENRNSLEGLEEPAWDEEP